MYNVYVPTYNRSTLQVFQMLSDPNVMITLCVRHEEASIRRSSDRINILDLGEDIHDIGETRKRILQYSIDQGDEYCIMIDDQISDLYYLTDKHDYDHISKAFSKAIEMFDHNKILIYGFWRQGSQFIGVDDLDVYFKGIPMQAVIIDNIVAKRHGIMYESMDVCGLEDMAFLIDGIRQGLVSVGGETDVIGKIPNKIIAGGNHTMTVKEYEKRRDEDCEKLLKYSKLRYGICLEKKYRHSIGMSLAYVRLDFDYFRTVLVNERSNNLQTIKEMFYD